MDRGAVGGRLALLMKTRRGDLTDLGPPLVCFAVNCLEITLGDKLRV